MSGTSGFWFCFGHRLNDGLTTNLLCLTIIRIYMENLKQIKLLRLYK